jgi:hypothetical protein
MIRWRILMLVLCLSTLLVSIGFAQSSSVQLIAEDNLSWTLPATQCDGDNFCQVRISPSGTISGWDMVNFRLYVSRLNASTYEVYDLSAYSRYLVFVTDFIVFDELGYAIMYSPAGGSRALSRYDLSTQTLQTINFPDGYQLIGCHRYTAVNQVRLRLIFQLGLEGRFMACSGSPQARPIIHIINVNTLTIEQSLDLNVGLGESAIPNWNTVAGGLDNKVYALVRNPEATIPNLPQIDEATQEIILTYDIANGLWSYQVKPKLTIYEILVALPNRGGILSQHDVLEGSEIIQFDPSFDIVRRFGLDGIFQGATSDGYLFFSTGKDYSDISVIKLESPSLVQH